MGFQKPDMTENTRRLMSEAINHMPFPDNVKKYLVELPLYEEEGIRILSFLSRNREATAEQAMSEVERITLDMTKKLGMSAMQRDRLYRV